MTQETLAMKCPKCQSDMKERQGKFGTFYGCTNWKPNNEGCDGMVKKPKSETSETKVVIKAEPSTNGEMIRMSVFRGTCDLIANGDVSPETKINEIKKWSPLIEKWIKTGSW